MNDGNVRRSSFDHKLHWELSLLVHRKRVLGVSLQTRIPTSHAIALAFQQALLQYSILYICRMRINAEKVHVQQASVQANSRLRVYLYVNFRRAPMCCGRITFNVPPSKTKKTEFTPRLLSVSRAYVNGLSETQAGFRCTSLAFRTQLQVQVTRPSNAPTRIYGKALKHIGQL